MIDKTNEELFRAIAEHVNEEVSFIESAVMYCEKHNIELEVLGSIIRRSHIMKAKFTEDAMRLKLLNAADAGG
jgi:hypothetical protein